MKSAQNQAGKATTTAVNTGAALGQGAANAESSLLPFETQQLLHPEGYSPTDTSAMLAAGEGGAGGTNASIAGEANLGAARTGNAAGFTAALDDAARQRGKANAATSEGIAAANAGVKQNQQQQAADALGQTAKMDTSGMLDAMGQVPQDINANVNAGNSGWLQNVTSVMKSLQGAGAGGVRL